jgi:hypothetical protein
MRQNEGVVPYESSGIWAGCEIACIACRAQASAHPNATVLALAERAADLILGRQGG